MFLYSVLYAVSIDTISPAITCLPVNFLPASKANAFSIASTSNKSVTGARTLTLNSLVSVTSPDLIVAVKVTSVSWSGALNVTLPSAIAATVSLSVAHSIATVVYPDPTRGISRVVGSATSATNVKFSLTKATIPASSNTGRLLYSYESTVTGVK